MATKLEEAFSSKEVFVALSNLNGDRAPGPDGFILPLAIQLGLYEGGHGLL